MGKIAATDDESPWLWGLVTFLLCCASLLIPLGFLRILIAWGAAFGLLIGYKIVRDDKVMKKKR